jgi:Fic family protein
VTPEQLLLYELDPKEPKSPDDESADWREVFNYGRALERGCELLKSFPICNRVIREMHELLMSGVRGTNKSPGSFRKWQVQIGSIGRYIPPPANEIERLMDNLERYINTDDNRYDPLVKAYIIHYQFEAIHPFGDGNGRVGRSLLALMIYKWLGHKSPWLYMSSYYDRYRDEYVDCLFKISCNGEMTKWIEFCLNGTIVQAKDAIQRCHKFICLKVDFKKRMKNKHSPRTPSIMDALFTSPVLYVTEIASRYGVRYATASSDIKRLVDAEILREIKDTHPRTYYAPEIMNIAYGEPEDLAEQASIPDASSNEQEQPSEQSPRVVSEIASPPSLSLPLYHPTDQELPPPDFSLDWAGDGTVLHPEQPDQ